MAVEQTYRKDEEGRVFLRQKETMKDVDGNTFTVVDKEVEFNHKAHLPQLGKKLTEIQLDISELQEEETRLMNKIAAIKAARDTVADSRELRG